MAVTTDTSEQLKGVLDLIRRIETGSVNFDPASPTPDTDKWIGDSVFVKDDADGIYKLSGSVPVSTINTESSGFWGLSAMAGDGRITPGAYQVSFGNIGGSNTSGEDGKYFGVYGYSDYISEGAKREISFSKAVLEKYLDVKVDNNGIITSIGKEAASVFLHNPSLANSTTWKATQNSLIGQYIDNFKKEQWSFYVGGRSQADITNGPSSSTDTREIPTNLAIMVDKMQTDFAGAFIFKDYTKVISNHTHPAYDYYKGQSYEDVVNTLFGATLNMKVIPGGTQAYGTTNTDFFQSKFNAGFITGYGYVGGFGGAFNLVNSLLMAKGTDQSEEGVLVPGGKTEIKDSNGNIIATYEMKVKMTSGNNTTETSDDVYEITNIPANLGGEYPTYAHYGALLSSTNLDSNPVNWADWKSVYTNLGLTVSDTNSISGFSLGYTPKADITDTNTAVGLVNYSSTNTTVNVSGNKSYVISPGTSSGGTTVNISNKVNNEWQASKYADGNVYNFLPNDNTQITDIDILKNNSYVLGGGETKKLFGTEGMITLDSSINYNLIIEKGGDGETTTSGAVYQIQDITSAQIKTLFDSMNDADTSNDKFTFVTPPVETANLIINASAAAGSVSIDANGKVKEVLLGTGNTSINDNNTVATKYIINPNTASNSSVSISDLDVTVDASGKLTINDTIDFSNLTGASISNIELAGSYNSKSDTVASSTAEYYDQYSYAVKLTISYGENQTMYLYLSFSNDKPVTETNISNYIRNSTNIILPAPDISKVLQTSNANPFNIKDSVGGVDIKINQADLTSLTKTSGNNNDPWFTASSGTAPTSGSYFEYINGTNTTYLTIDNENIKNVDNTKFDYVLTKDSDATKNPNLYHLTITTKSDVKMQYTNGVSNNFVSFTNSATIKDYKYEVNPTDSILTALLGTNGVNNKANIASIIHSLAVDNGGIDLGKSKKYFVNDDEKNIKDITLTTSSSKWKTTDNAYVINSYYKSNSASYGLAAATYYKQQIAGGYEKNISYIDGGKAGVSVDMSGSTSNYILALEDTISGSALSFQTTKMFDNIKSFKLGNGNDIIDLSSINYTINTDASGNINNNYTGDGFNIKINGANSSGNKVVFGGNGKNYIETGSGADIIFGGSADDTLIGGAGNDVIFGGAGSDTITGGAGVDTMTGGTGNDTFIFNLGDSGSATGTADKITDFTTADKISVSASGSGTLSITSAFDIVNKTLTLTQAGQSSMILNLMGIDDNIISMNNYINYKLTGGTGNDTITGGAGNDTITGGTGVDTMTGGTGNDTFIFNWGDSGSTTGTADKITDFTTADKITITGATGATQTFDNATDILTITQNAVSMKIDLSGIDSSITDMTSYITIS